MLAMKHSVEAMRKGSGGSMIAMSSVTGLIGFPGLAPYAASKHAVYGLVKTVALELGEAGIRANAICPAAPRFASTSAEAESPDCLRRSGRDGAQPGQGGGVVYGS